MVDETFINEESLKSYLSINGNLEITQDLLRKKYLKNVAELLGFSSTIDTTIPHIGKISGFSTYLKHIKLLPAKIALQVLTSPAAHHWNAMTRDFLAALISGKRTSILNKYLDHLNVGLEDGLNNHLNDFGRFSLSAHILATVEFTVEIALIIKLPVTLPGTRLVFVDSICKKDQGGGLGLYSLNDSQILLLSDLSRSDSIETVSIGFNDGESVLVTNLPSWKGEKGEVVIDAFDPCLNLPYVESYPRIRDLASGEDFVTTLTEAFDHLARYDAITATEIELVTSTITLMDTSAIEAEMCSGTSSAIFGAYFVSATKNPLYLAEMLLHEFSHNKLRLLEENHPFLLDDSSKESQYYSPWRDDPRPLDGIQHGLYVFSSIAYFWLYIWTKENISSKERLMAQSRVSTLLIQLKNAEKEFSANAKLTKTGVIFVDEIKKRINYLDERVFGWNLSDLLPFFAGVVKDKKLRTMPIVSALRKHQLDWEQAYRQREVGIS